MSLVGTRPPTLDEWEKYTTIILSSNCSTLLYSSILLCPDYRNNEKRIAAVRKK